MDCNEDPCLHEYTVNLLLTTGNGFSLRCFLKRIKYMEEHLAVAISHEG